MLHGLRIVLAVIVVQGALTEIRSEVGEFRSRVSTLPVTRPRGTPSASQTACVLMWLALSATDLTTGLCAPLQAAHDAEDGTKAHASRVPSAPG
jgi:hypothetical protein